MFDWIPLHLPSPVALAVVAALGYLLGLLRSSDRSDDALRSRSEFRRASSVARELEKIAWSVRGHISSHHARLGQFKKRLAEIRRSGGDPEALKALTEEAEQILTPTLRLASQIASAYDRIREQAEQLTSLAGARIDPLTGIANRQFAEDSIASQFAAMRRYQGGFAVALFEIDQFHRVNDVDGSVHGDQVLQELAAILNEVARETDLVARFGGQTFVIIMPQTDLEGACYFAERFRRAVEKLPPVTVSGAVTVALDGDTIGHLLGRLEEALLVSKHSRGREVYRHDGIQIESVLEPDSAEFASC